MIDHTNPTRPKPFDQWQFFCHWHCPHSALGEQSLMERYCELLEGYAEQKRKTSSGSSRNEPRVASLQPTKSLQH